MIEPFKLRKILYRTDEVQTLLSFGKDKIYSLVEEGELLAHRVNGARTKPLRIVGTSIAEFVARHSIDIIND